jgi:DNA primase
MIKSTASSQQTLPSTTKLKKPEVPSINLLPKLKGKSIRIAPEYGETSTSNSKSASFIKLAKPSTKVHTSNKSKELSREISDNLCFEEFKKAEIMRARKFQSLQFPYWFIDNFNDLDVSRSIRKNNNMTEMFKKSVNNGFIAWNDVRFIQKLESKVSAIKPE